jgi:hypothetical protein
LAEVRVNVPGVTHTAAMSKQPAPAGDTKESGIGGKDGEVSITDAWADPIKAPATTARKAEHRSFDTANSFVNGGDISFFRESLVRFIQRKREFRKGKTTGNRRDTQDDRKDNTIFPRNKFL